MSEVLWMFLDTDHMNQYIKYMIIYLLENLIHYIDELKVTDIQLIKKNQPNFANDLLSCGFIV